MHFFKRKPGSEIKNLANSLRPLTNSKTYLLSSSSSNYKALDSCGEEDITDLVSWGIFNPFGPTMSSLVLVNSPETKEYFIFRHWNNPTSQAREIFGLIPEAVFKNKSWLVIILDQLFVQFNSEILGDPPTYVKFYRNAPIDQKDIKGMFFQALKTLDHEEFKRTCNLLETFQGDPWQRASAELKGAMETIFSKSW